MGSNIFAVVSVSYEKIKLIPVGSTNIHIRDTSSLTLLSLFDMYSGVFRLNGNRYRPEGPGSYRLHRAGDKLHYSRKSDDQEHLFIQGPTKSDIQVFAFLPEQMGQKGKTDELSIKWNGTVDFYSREKM